ncbi:MAG: ABC-F family ATP-binding cassette domain-containing protein [Candidatus Zixiibacteriota bacterium]
MTLFTADSLSKRHKDQVILDRVSFTLRSGERIALVGKNGIGKTTLLEIIAGKQSVDSGVVCRPRDCIVDYVEQEKNEYLDMTLFDFVADARSDLIQTRREIARLEQYLEENPADSVQLERFGTLQHDYERLDGFSFDSQVGAILVGLGFAADRLSERLRHFSGGERNRAGLARILAGQGNLLLLDEPTNHLDIESTAWLEQYLRELDKTMVVVSHDRTFLNATTDQVWELTGGKIEKYFGGIERYLTERVTRREQSAHWYRHQQEEIKRLEEYIRRNMAGQKTKQAQSKLKYLGRIKRLPPPPPEDTGPSISVHSSGRSYAHVLSMQDVTVAYGSQPIVEDLDLDIYRGDKVGLIGRNGSGKTTLLKAVIGELAPVAGSVRLGNNVDVAYFDQDLSDLVDDATVLDNLWNVDPSTEVGAIRSFLARFGFTGEDVLKRVAALSGGEKTKLCLAKLLYHPANLIIMDEPTNHLDMAAREALEAALQDYDGSCLIVSHDRYFLDQVVDRIVHIHNGHARVYSGNYSAFAEKMAAAAPPPKVKSPDQKREFVEFKERSKQRSRHRKAVEATRADIAAAESELEVIESQLAANDRAADWEHLSQLTERQRQLENEILELYAELDRLEAAEHD